MNLYSTLRKKLIFKLTKNRTQVMYRITLLLLLIPTLLIGQTTKKPRRYSEFFLNPSLNTSYSKLDVGTNGRKVLLTAIGIGFNRYKVRTEKLTTINSFLITDRGYQFISFSQNNSIINHEHFTSRKPVIEYSYGISYRFFHGNKLNINLQTSLGIGAYTIHFVRSCTYSSDEKKLSVNYKDNRFGLNPEFSFNFGIGLSYDISSRVAVKLTPTYSLVSGITAYQHSFGLRLGILLQSKQE